MASSNDAWQPLTRIRLIHQIETMQQSNPEVNHTERDFIYRPLQDLEKYTIYNLKAWHKQAMNIIRVTKKRIAPYSTNRINSYFPKLIPRRSNPTTNIETVPVSSHDPAL
jgi:hypothetical protein